MYKLPRPKDDGLVIPKVGEHSKYKHYFIERYIYAFTTSMKSKKWAGLHYIDLFAGAGIEKLKNSGELAWGSPLIAVQSPYPFTRVHLCEENEKKFSALKIRVNKLRPDSQILFGDANEKIHDILREIPTGTLSLTFIDPYGLHADLKTLKLLGQKRTDLIIFFPDHVDALRNWAAYYLKNPQSNLDRYLGSGIDWRTLLNNKLPRQRPELLRNMYVEQIKKQLGYTNFDFERIKTVKGRPIYYLIFCSHSATGAHLWHRIALNKPNGQRTFDFE